MSKIISIRLTKASPKTGPFTLSDQLGNVIATDVSKSSLIEGMTYNINDNVSMITITSTGYCNISKTIDVITNSSTDKFTESRTACLHRHLTNITLYNNYYGRIEPYIIEYPFSTSPNTEILQSVIDYTKAFQYTLDGTGVFNYNDKIEVDDMWFNNVIIYNGQQSSGILEMVSKPHHNLQTYMSYPLYRSDRKTITYTKCNNFYHYNTFWSIVKDKSLPLFLTSCESLSIDKIVNQSNMDYSTRSFKKESFRSKDLRIRHILNDRSDVNLVSQFIYCEEMISYD